MADIRALMAQERQARRVNHEFASYTKSGALMCTACELNIKAETLWDGHLRSTNHRANAKKLHEAIRTVAKRKIEDVDEIEGAGDIDARKKLKPKSRTPSLKADEPSEGQTTPPMEDGVSGDHTGSAQVLVENQVTQPLTTYTTVIQTASSSTAQQPSATIDEDEWAAFERDVASLAQPDYSAATITAAPVSAAQLEAEAESDKKRLRDTEAEDEKEEGGRRMEQEFELMEEMEERIRRLKEKREVLRSIGPAEVDTGQPENDPPAADNSTLKDEAGNDSDDSDVDDWYS